jgi:murein DD-endopeptidase MepM/ murein hydrolase activator NlpD
MGFDPGFGRPLPANVRAVGGSGWGRPRSGTHPHQGLDIWVPVGTPVLAMADGVAVRVQATDDGDPGGVRVALRHPSGLVSRYMHLSRAAIPVGQRVRKGQIIGYSGNTGVGSTGPHLHVDLKAPAELLPAIARAMGVITFPWGPLMASYGYGVPAEPWVPVDEYNERTRADAAAVGIPLYRRPVGLLALALGVGLGVAAYRLLT